MTTVAEESIVGVNVVKAFGQEDPQEARFQRSRRARSSASPCARRDSRPSTSGARLPAAPRAGRRAPRRRVPRHRRLERCRSAHSSRSTSTCSCSSSRCACSACGSVRSSARRPPASGSSRSSTSPRRSTIATGAAAASRGRRPDHRSKTCASSTTQEPRSCADVDLEIEPGTRRRADRPHGLRQVDADGARSTLLRPDRRPRARRRRRRPRPRPRLASRIDRDRLAGSVSLLRDGAGEHRVRAPGRRARRRRVGRARRPGARVRRAAPRRLRHASSASAESRSRAASGSALRSHGHCSSTRAS